MDRERPLEGGDWRVKTHPAPSPYQALGLGGRSRHGPSRRCATGDRAADPQDDDAPSDRRKVGCASPEARSAHRHPASFARSSTAVSGSAGASANGLRPASPPTEGSGLGTRRPSTYYAVRPDRVSADPALQAADVAIPDDPDLAFEDRPPGIFGGCFEGVRGAGSRPAIGREPVYPMCYIGAWRGGRCAPPSNPHPRARMPRRTSARSSSNSDTLDPK